MDRNNLVTIDDSSSDDDALEIVEDEAEDDVDEGDNDIIEQNEIIGSPIEFVIESPRTGTKHPFKYKCPYCSKFYTSRSGLTSHKNSVHLRAKPYRCEICNEHFSSSAARVAHIHRSHTEYRGRRPPQQTEAGDAQPKPLVLVMPTAHKNTLQSKSTSKADRSVILPNRHVANSSNVVAPLKMILPRRLPEKRPVSPPSIQILDVKKIKDSVSSYHVHAISASKPMSAESYECERCNVHFEFTDDLIQHLSNHNLLLPPPQDYSDTEVEESNRCPMCSFVASDGAIIGESQTKLQEHIMSVHFKAPLPHLKANEGTNNNNNDGHDIDLSSGTRCRFCFKEFERDTHLQIHIRYHHRGQSNSQPASNSSPWPCRNCLVPFANEYSLRDHQVKGCILPYNCEICNAKFAMPEQLSEHINTMHNPSRPVPMTQHSGITQHPGLSFTAKCSDCGKTFISEQLLKTHKITCPVARANAFLNRQINSASLS